MATTANPSSTPVIVLTKYCYALGDLRYPLASNFDHFNLQEMAFQRHWCCRIVMRKIRMEFRGRRSASWCLRLTVSCKVDTECVGVGSQMHPPATCQDTKKALRLTVCPKRFDSALLRRMESRPSSPSSASLEITLLA